MIGRLAKGITDHFLCS